jgi:hypothetical protein
VSDREKITEFASTNRVRGRTVGGGERGLRQKVDNTAHNDQVETTCSITLVSATNSKSCPDSLALAVSVGCCAEGLVSGGLLDVIN